MGYYQPSGGGANSYSMVLDGVIYPTRESFTAAVVTLPPRSRLVWRSGCNFFDEIPLGPAPRMTVREFKAFCSSHQIRFEYLYGLYPDPLRTETFSVSGPLCPKDTSIRHWLETQGVAFPPKAFARWDSGNQRLTVRNTDDNLSLIPLIIEHVRNE
jgi:hypothetical protein